MNKRFLTWFILITLFFSKEINSRPISYQGGWTIMQKNDFNRHSFHSHFSPSINYSLGYRGEYWRKKEWTFPQPGFHVRCPDQKNPRIQAATPQPALHRLSL